jgi:hypothetical protein
MSIWNKILVGLICVASLGFFYAAGRTLKTHQNWGECVRQFEAKINLVRSENEKLLNDIRPLRQDLNRVLLDRGRAWRNCDPKSVKVLKDTGDAEIRIATDPAATSVLAEKGSIVVYVFEEADVKNGGRYLGEFRATAAGEKQAVLQPTNNSLTSRESDRLASAKGPWVLYEQMPRDNHSVFADLPDDEKKAVLPADVAAEYLKDGQPAAQDDPQDRVVDGRYVRPLRDYQTLFSAYRADLTDMRDLFEATTRDKMLVDTALSKAKSLLENIKKHVVDETDRLAKHVRQRDIAAAHRKALEEKVAAFTAEVAKVIETNGAMAGQMAQLQWDTVRHIDQRVRSMVQSDTGRK